MTTDFIQTKRQLLSRESELALFEEWKAARDAGNRRDEDRLFKEIAIQFSPIVKKLVRKMKGYNMDPEELISEALMGLVQAAINFDPERGYRFATYARNCVLNTLFTYITKNYFITNICSNSKNRKAFFRLRRLMGDQIRESGEARMTVETAQSLADTMGVDVGTVVTMNTLLREPYQSLNETVGEEDDAMTREDKLESRELPQDQQIEGNQMLSLREQILSDSLLTLDDRSRRILIEQELREDEDRMTLEQLGQQFSVTKEWIRQIRDAAKDKLLVQMTARMMEQNINRADILD